MTSQAPPPAPPPLFFQFARPRPWRELAVLASMVMDLSWGVPWFRSLTPATYRVLPGRAFAVFMGVVAFAYLTVKLLATLRLKMKLRRWIVGGLVIGSALFGLRFLLYEPEALSFTSLLTRPIRELSDLTALIPDEFIVIAVVLGLWLRGATLANEKIGPRVVIGGFQNGVLMLVAFVFFNTMITGEQIGNMAYLFLSAGLLAMGAARVAVLRSLRGGKENPFDRRWLAGLVLAVAGAVGLAALAAALVSGEDAILGVVPRLLVGLVVAAAALVAFPVMLGLLYLLYGAVDSAQNPDSPVFQALAALVGRLQGMIGALFERLMAFSAWLQPVLDFIDGLTPFARVVVLWGILLGLGGLVLLLLHLRERRRRTLQAEQTDSLLARGDLLRLWREALRLRLRNAANRLAEAADRRRRQRLRAAAKIRRIYAELMALCAKLDSPRPPAQTPLEYLPALESLFPTLPTEVAVITQAYVRVRYGQLPETRGEVAAVEAAWAQVREEGRKREEG